MSDVLVTDFSSGRNFTLDDYNARFPRVEELVRTMYSKYELDDSELVFGDSEDDDNGRFLWPVFAVDELRDSQGYCDLFADSPEEQALFLFEQLMDAY